MSDSLNWHDLEILHAVLEHKSFSGAARFLGLSQPTVSRHVDALERKLGRELFLRGHAGPEPNELALSLAGHTARMNEGMFAIQRALDGKEAVPEGIVTLSMPYGLGGVPVAQALIGFHEHYPDISIDLKTGPLQSNLGRREADIDLRWEAPSEPEVITRPLGCFHLGMYATPGYLERLGTPRCPADLRDHYFPFVDDVLMQRILASLKAAGIEPRRYPFRCSGNLMLAAILCTMGFTLNLWPLSLEPATVQRVMPDLHMESPAMWMTMHSSLRRNARIRAVWDWLTGHLPGVFELTRTA